MMMNTNNSQSAKIYSNTKIDLSTLSDLSLNELIVYTAYLGDILSATAIAKEMQSRQAVLLGAKNPVGVLQ